MTDLQTRILAAHAEGATRELCHLYMLAAEQAHSEDEAAFFLTQAYIFALDAGLPVAMTLRDRLISTGRETP